jgi:hypothetical protein
MIVAPHTHTRVAAARLVADRRQQRSMCERVEQTHVAGWRVFAVGSSDAESRRYAIVARRPHANASIRRSKHHLQQRNQHVQNNNTSTTHFISQFIQCQRSGNNFRTQFERSSFKLEFAGQQRSSREQLSGRHRLSRLLLLLLRAMLFDGADWHRCGARYRVMRFE